MIQGNTLEVEINKIILNSKKILTDLNNIKKNGNYFNFLLSKEILKKKFDNCEISEKKYNLENEEKLKKDFKKKISEIKDFLISSKINDNSEFILHLDYILNYFYLSENNKKNLKEIFEYLEKRENENKIQILFSIQKNIEKIKSEKEEDIKKILKNPKNEIWEKKINFLKLEKINLKKEKSDLLLKFKKRMSILKKIIDHKENCLKKIFQKKIKEKNLKLIKNFEISEDKNILKQVIINLSKKNENFEILIKKSINEYEDILEQNLDKNIYEKIFALKKLMNMNLKNLKNSKKNFDQFSVSSDLNENLLNLKKSIFGKIFFLVEKKNKILGYEKKLIDLKKNLENLKTKFEEFEFKDDNNILYKDLKKKIDNKIFQKNFIKKNFQKEKEEVEILQNELIKIYYFNEQKKNHLIFFLKSQKSLLYKRNKEIKKFFFKLKSKFSFLENFSKLKRFLKRFNDINFINNNIKKKYFLEEKKKKNNNYIKKLKDKKKKIKNKNKNFFFNFFQNNKKMDFSYQKNINVKFFENYSKFQNQFFDNLNLSINSFQSIKSISNEIFENFKNNQKLNSNNFIKEKILEFEKILEYSENILWREKNENKNKFSFIQNFFEENFLKLKEILFNNKVFKELINLQNNKISDKDKLITKLTLNLKKISENKKYSNNLKNPKNFKFEKNYFYKNKKKFSIKNKNRQEAIIRKMERLEIFTKIRCEKIFENIRKIKKKIKSIINILSFLKKIKDSIFFNFQISENCQNFEIFYKNFKNKLNSYKSQISESKKDIYQNEISNHKEIIYNLKQKNKNFEIFLFSLKMIFNKKEVIITDKDPLEVICEKINRYFSKFWKLEYDLENKELLVFELKSQIKDLREEFEEVSVLKNELEKKILRIESEKKKNLKVYEIEKNDLFLKLVGYEKILDNLKNQSFEGKIKFEKEKNILNLKKKLQEKDYKINKMEMEIKKFKIFFKNKNLENDIKPDFEIKKQNYKEDLLKTKKEDFLTEDFFKKNKKKEASLKKTINKTNKEDFLNKKKKI